MSTDRDKQQLKAQGITEGQLNIQLKHFEEGFPFLKIVSAATTQKGILDLNDSQQKDYLQKWNKYLEGNNTVTKFVPASGAASRMFKDLFNFLDASYNSPQSKFELEFFQGLKKFAFYKALDQACQANEKKTIEDLYQNKEYKKIVQNLLEPKGLNYGALPKGLLDFHLYPHGVRKPVEEHMVEGALYASSSNKVNLHFTVSPEHKDFFQQLVNAKQADYEQSYKVKYNISFSTQKLSTDTVAVNLDNTLFRKQGQLFFRPGGHGALIENLNDINSDIIFVKNIDNVIPDRLKETEVKYKKLLAGVLVAIQGKIFTYLTMLDTGNYTHDELIEMLYFLQNELNVKNPDTKLLEDAELALYIKSKLDRPIRVCGMVKNEGEPGGGPFLVVNSDNTVSPQILEGSQIDMDKAKNKQIVEESLYFNPVDLVCAVKNYEGKKFDLPNYVDNSTGFISEKSLEGEKIKALELPGLWNGAMSDWNTLFVVVPIQVFNPVKTVNDLLREAHL